MNDTIHLRIITSDGVVYERMANYVHLPLEGGSAGVLRGHIPLLGAVKDGTLKCCFGGKEEYVYIGSGVADINADELSVLTRIAEIGSMIDPKRAAASEQRARERLSGKDVATDRKRAADSLSRAIARQEAYRLSQSGE